MIAKKAKFTLPFLPGKEYEGYYSDAPGDTWNGNPQPYLTYPARTELLNDIGSFLTEEIETEEGNLRLCPIGHGMWQWEKIE